MKNYRGKFLCALAILAVILVLAGCSKEVKLKEPDVNGYEAVALELDGLEEEEYIWNLCCSDNEIFFSAFNRNDSIEEGVQKTHVYQYDLKNQRADKLPILLESDKHILCLSENAKGEFVMLLSSEDKYYMAKYDETGACILEKEITESLGGMEMHQVIFDRENRLYYLAMNQINVFDETGMPLHTFETDGMFFNPYLGRDGNIYVSNFKVDGEEHICRLNLQEKSLEQYGKSIEEEWNKHYAGGLAESKYWDYIANNGQSIIGVDIKKKKAQRLVDLKEAGLNPEMLQEITEIEENTFLVLNMDGTNGGRELVLLKPSLEEDNAEEKIHITMAGLQINSFLKEAVYRFNRENQEYKIEIKDYQGDLSRLSADLMTEGTIDLLCLDGLPKERYVKQGLLCNLNSFLEQDEEIKKEDFLEPVYDLLSNQQGMYSWTPGFAVETVFGKASLLGEEYSLTPQKAMGLQQELAEGKKLYYAINREEMMKKLMEANLNNFVNPDNGTCSFQNEKLMNLLEFAEKFPEEEEEDMTMPQKVQADQVVFVRETITDFTSFLFYEKMFGEKISFTGYPAYDNPGNLFSSAGMETAILEQSRHKEGAWEYLKYITSKSYLKQYCDMQFLPVRKDCIKDYIQIMSATEPYVDEQGQENKAYHCTIGYDDYTIELGALEEEQISGFWTLLEHMYLPVQLENGIWELITEETERYFHGEISKEECAGNLEKRISLYLDE